MRVVINGREQAVGARTVEDLVRDLQLDGRPVAVELNREVVPKARFRETALREGDRLEIVSLVGGG